MFIAIISDTYGEIKEELVDKTSDIQLASFIKKNVKKLMNILNNKREIIIDIQEAVTIADVLKNGKIDFAEFRNNLKVYKKIRIKKQIIIVFGLDKKS